MPSSKFALAWIVLGLGEQSSDFYSSSPPCHLLLAPNPLPTSKQSFQLSTMKCQNKGLVRFTRMLLRYIFLTVIPFLGLCRSQRPFALRNSHPLVAFPTPSSPLNLVIVTASARESFHILGTLPIYWTSLHTLIIPLLPVRRVFFCHVVPLYSPRFNYQRGG